MSWLKLNDSLNKVKGQITSFAQEVLAEGIVEEEEEQRNPEKELGQAQQKISELADLCATQDQEIATLRKQIAEYQQQQLQSQSKSPNEQLPPSSSKQEHQHGITSIAPTPSSALEDSWFWDPEQNISSTSSSSKKDDDNDSPRSGADLTTIPLEAPASESEIIERLHRQLVDKSQQLKKQQLENALINEKLSQVGRENRELNENIEELDRQHELVVENLIGVKKALQEKCLQLEDELRLRQGEANVAKDYDALKESYSMLEQSCDAIRQENAQLKGELEGLRAESDATRDELEAEIGELRKSLDASEKRIKSSSDVYDRTLNRLTAEKATLDEQTDSFKNDISTLQEKLESITLKYESLSRIEADFESMKKEYDDLKRKGEEDAFVALQREDDQAEVDKVHQMYDQLTAEVERWKKDCDRLQEDNLTLQKSEKAIQSQLSELEALIVTKDERIVQLEQHIPDQTQVELLQREVGELQNELRSVIFDNSVQLDAKEKEWQEKLNFLKAENSRIQHNKDTLEADLMQYEKECASLMKNNDMLIGEIENLKCKKLETINENAEDSIVILEKQLEDCSMLNKSLEDEYQEVNKKLEEVLEEREELEAKVESSQESLEQKSKTIKDLQLALETLENEKSNLLFEINEIKSKATTEKEQMEIESYQMETESLKSQLTTINEDHASLVLKLQQLQQASVENVKKLEAELSELRSSLKTKESVTIQLQEEVATKIEELNSVRVSNEKAIESLRQKLEAESQKSTFIAVEKDEIERRLHETVVALNQQSTALEEHSAQNVAKLAELTQTVDTLTKQKDNLVQLITTKHNENVQYHAEIQRLSLLLQNELTAKNEPVTSPECSKCPVLQGKLNGLEAQCKKLENFDKLTDQVQFLREKSEILSNNLQIEQNNQKLLQQEKQEMMEQRNGLAKDLERLRQHLLEIEEAHTQETVELQQRCQETQEKLQALEQDVKKSTNALTSASIRANQHAETLQAQYQLLLQQRDELTAKLGAADDREYKNQASLTNLQCALEQFQKNRERDIELATFAIRKELEETQKQEVNLKAEIRQMQQQLTDAKNGLLAAARISDQLEIAQVTVASLKDELLKSNEKFYALEERLQTTEASQADKVEKTLVKNLVIGYVAAPNQNDKLQILKLISAVLTMDQNECYKIGLNRTGGGWFNSILGGGGGAHYNKESLTEAFVKFLEKESTPRPTNAGGSGLLNIMNQSQQPAGGFSRTPTPTQQQTAQDQNPYPVPTTPVPVQPILLGESTILQQTTSFQPPRSSSSILKDILSDS
ncbi:thyroid receptor-interacting protein 11 isoform X1 [Toxorhynchites rutilus septentrionalis]|uniref:thyroid receptor-interacting protein 11 isoform X1 n=1 Tax=Toxorhynchites rutilus septentrionalis TaxID=329112 RepID=UPI00247A162A|nr:thyroid receptor-interacting protein 11 isoform X1 [Toxorhynchites rutilus septentrionalis]